MRNIALRLMYDGTNYHGWQFQKNAVTVEETLEKALSRVCGEPVKAVGCGRTDAGVHAKNYCANFKTNSRIPVDKIPLAVNTLLPNDIAVQSACEVDMGFNAILSCEKKEYTYLIYNSRIKDPFYHCRAYFYPVHLNENTMAEAAGAFVGEHDFSAVRSVGTDVQSTIRTVYYFQVERKGDIIELRVCANGFLYNMARAMVGTVIYSALGKIAPESIEEILNSGRRSLAGPTVPPQGLYMTKVWYNGAAGNLMDN